MKAFQYLELNLWIPTRVMIGTMDTNTSVKFDLIFFIFGSNVFTEVFLLSNASRTYLRNGDMVTVAKSHNSTKVN